MTFENNIDFAYLMDSKDSLASFRDKFSIPLTDEGKPFIYFTGNSLGLMPKATRQMVNSELDAWEKYGVEAHFKADIPWKDYHEVVTESLARLVGAKPIEVVAMNSLSTNLNLLLISFYRPDNKRNKIIAEASAFGSDIYAFKSHIEYHGFNADECLILLEPKAGNNIIETEDIITVINDNADSLAIVLLGNSNFYSGQAFEIEKITKAAHSVGAYSGYDLAHGIGNLNLKLHDWKVDFACWCSYKYLNSGPGSIGGIFVHERFANDLTIPRLSGWWGHNKANRFQMPRKFEPLAGAEGWQNSNPAILPLACLKTSLDIFDEAGIENLNAKSVQLTGFLEFLLNSIENDNIEIITPSDISQRGCQLSIRLKDENKMIFDALEPNGIIADWRHPDVIRVAPVPLYNSFVDVFNFYTIFKNILDYYA